MHFFNGLTSHSTKKTVPFGVHNKRKGRKGKKGTDCLLAHFFLLWDGRPTALLLLLHSVERIKNSMRNP
jgi:hypothetical protein